MFTWRRITLWLRKRHKGINWSTLYRRFLTAKGDTPAEGTVEMFRPQMVEVTRYRWRGYHISGATVRWYARRACGSRTRQCRNRADQG